ncbi:hypothetical protein WN990_27550 [Kitasatospora purpeofusca]|uniref:hypothetical protein n=1 Tax=Kitasatospora purpeofusca TaxID=67352 RepID=UPI000B337F0E|nr:hypothetical protein [Kitasatospora purpeofusca]MCX4759100.1 hypothetical protein [Kitasatospora purpeofusca]WSR30487.1 hypothetical protein OG715_05660 [Kitasatospora purpeofusca]WSR38726.1 hypothetical protein OG196_06295 [Kitasatospora purpeofusca]
MNRYGKAALATLGFLLAVAGLLALLGSVPSDTESGSLLRAAAGGGLAGATGVWVSYLARTLRSRRR